MGKTINASLKGRDRVGDLFLDEIICVNTKKASKETGYQKMSLELVS
jgi:hypothetical protein